MVHSAQWRSAPDRQVVIYLSKTHSQSERDWRASVPFAPSRAALSMLRSCQLHTPGFNPSPRCCIYSGPCEGPALTFSYLFRSHYRPYEIRPV